MILRLGGIALLISLATTPAAACPAPSDRLLFHSCWGEAKVAVLLLPEQLPLPEPGTHSRRVVVTGAYTGQEGRGEGLPNPVGLFVHGGAVINRNLGRMDGVLLVDPATGQPELHHRRRLAFAGRSFDLTSLAERRAFLELAAERGISALQSHLLIVDGDVDVRPQEDAPVFLRRLLFVDAHGFGLYQTRWPVTLHDAARQISEAYLPRMALNLDMGSSDYCQRAEAGEETSCGSLDRETTGKLSNLLMLTLE
jgi:hypothetical protein